MEVSLNAAMPPVVQRGSGTDLKSRSSSGGSAPVRTSATFSRDSDSGLISIKIVNSSTGDVIRSIPSRDYVRLPQAAGNLKGTLLDETA